MFCPVCGKKVKYLIEGICENCYNKKYNNNNIISKHKLKKCKICNKIFVDNKELSKKFLRQQIKKYFSKEVSSNIDVDLYEDEEKFYLNIPLSGKINKIFFPKEMFICKKCMYKYYTPGKKKIIIQLRGNYNKFETFIKEILQKGYKISDYIEKKEGLDIYLDEKMKSLEKLIKKYKTLGEDIKITRKLVTYDHQRGKNLYRVTIRIKFK